MENDETISLEANCKIAESMYFDIPRFWSKQSPSPSQEPSWIELSMQLNIYTSDFASDLGSCVETYNAY